MFYSAFRFATLSLLIACTFTSANAQHNLSIPPEKPKLIVQIVVSQMRFDYLQRYESKFTYDGFRMIASEGAFCKNARYNYLLTQAYPGLATISTGSNPSTHGIVSDKWISKLTNEEIKAVADDKVETVGGSFFSGKYSPKNLITSTLGDEIRISNPRSKVVGIAMDPGSAILSTGHNANSVYWFDTERGFWVSSSHFLNEAPAWVDTFNTKGFAQVYAEREWNALNPISQYEEADTATVKNEESKKRIAQKLRQMISGIIQGKKSKTDFVSLTQNPFGNLLTKDFAIAAILGEELGKDDNTDLLTVTFSPTRNISQKYGPHSIEIEDTYLKLDKEIAHFLQFINATVGKENVLVVLTSDQGVASTPDHMEKSKIPGGYFDPNKAMMLLSSYLNITYGTGKWVVAFHEKQIYLNHRLIEDSNLQLAEVQQRIANFMIQFTGVANVSTGQVLQTSNFTSGILQKFQNSYNPRRSGDIIINLEPGWVEKNGTVTSANSPYSYDAHVPLIWYGWKIKRKAILNPVSMTDIAPTISTLIGITWPNGATGTPIREIIE